MRFMPSQLTTESSKAMQGVAAERARIFVELNCLLALTDGVFAHGREYSPALQTRELGQAVHLLGGWL
eukprot:m.191305 g.191305  ORF g.191305 m.191305 type:complete len:68 (+) comp53636_c0_seq4:562-765(+)